MATDTVKAIPPGRNCDFPPRWGQATWLAALILAVLWLGPGCAPSPQEEKLTKEVEALKTEMATVKEQVAKLEAAQKILTDLLQAKTAAPAVPAAPALSPFGTANPGAPPPGQPTAAAPLTVEELLHNKESLLGTRVTVRGMPGPVLMHKHTLFLSSPGGMIEVMYGNLADKRQVDRLTAQNLETPLTVTGILSAGPGQPQGQVHLTIMADAVEF